MTCIMQFDVIENISKAIFIQFEIDKRILQVIMNLNVLTYLVHQQPHASGISLFCGIFELTIGLHLPHQFAMSLYCQRME